jgi:hypothetical protein
MYGMINLAVEQLICENHGVEAWNQIKKQAGVTVSHFVNMETYDDSITYNLVGSASEVLGISTEDLLDSFGEYFIMYTAKQGYGEMLKLGGKTFPEYLSNLNMLHFRLANMLPHFVAPTFKVSNVTDNSLNLTYISERNGLTPMVKGLIRGLGKILGTPCEIDHIGANAELENAQDFMVRW